MKKRSCFLLENKYNHKLSGDKIKCLIIGQIQLQVSVDFLVVVHLIKLEKRSTFNHDRLWISPYETRSVRVAERLALPTSDHGVAGSNPA